MRVFLLVLCILVGNLVFAQNDMLITDKDTMKVKITDIASDRINVELNKNGKKVSSYLPREKVIDYRFEIIEKLKAEANPENYYTLTTIDKTELNGYVKQIWKDSIAFETEYFGLTIIKAQNIREVSSNNFVISSKGDVWFPNPNATRYYFGPSAYNLEKGEGYYQNVYVFLNMFNYGLTDHISIGAGFEFLSTFTGNPTLFITPKVGIPIGEKFGVGGGVLAGIVGGEFTAGILYGVSTFGSKEHNVTGGLGWGFVDSEMTQAPIITFSAMTRVGRKISLVTENWFAPTNPGYYGIISYGIRLFGPKMSFDIALINNGDIASEIPVGIPYIDYVIKF